MTPVAAVKAAKKKAAKKPKKPAVTPEQQPAQAPASETNAPEPSQTPAAPQIEAGKQGKGSNAKVYAVMVDAQNVAYLRVAQKEKSSLFIINTGSKKVDLIEMDNPTIKSRSLETVSDASVLEAAKVLAKPLTSGIIVSDRAKKYLDEILNDKELLMTTKKKAAASAAASSKKSAKKEKTPSAPRAKATDSTVVTFKKAAKEGDLPKQAAEIVALIQKAKQLPVSELLLKMDGIIQTKQTMQIIWSFYRNRLVKEGYVTLGA